jgi:hypothetical protein
MHWTAELLPDIAHAVRYTVVETSLGLTHDLIALSARRRTIGGRLLFWLVAGSTGGAAAGISTGSGLAMIYRGATWHNTFLLVPSLAFNGALLGAVVGALLFAACEFYARRVNLSALPSARRTRSKPQSRRRRSIPGRAKGR